MHSALEFRDILETAVAIDVGVWVAKSPARKNSEDYPYWKKNRLKWG